MEIAEVLKELRGDMTKTEFSKGFDCSKSILTMYEKGKRTPTIDTLQQIADATNTELIIEFREKEQVENREDTEEEKVDKEIKRLSKLTPKQKVTEEDMAEMIKNGEW